MSYRKSLLIVFTGLFSLALQGQTVDFDFDVVCFGEPTSLISQSSSPAGIFKYEWDLNGDGVFGDAFGNTVNIKLPAGNNNIGHRIIDSAGVAVAKYHLVEVGYIPVADFTFSQPTCTGQETQFTNTSSIIIGEIEDSEWEFGDEGTSSKTNPSHVFGAPGNHNVLLTVYSHIGCPDTTTRTVSITQGTVIDDILFNPDSVIYSGESTEVRVLASDAQQILWSTGEGTQSITLWQAGNYSVEVFSGPCSDRRTFGIYLKDRIGVANLLTPNGDGHNDKWEIFNLASIDPCQVSIYNRYGTEVFQSTNYTNNWGGTYKGNPLPEGTYYYILKCKDNKVKQGSINILR